MALFLPVLELNLSYHMHRTKPATAADSHAALERKLGDAANMLWARANLKPPQNSPTVLGLNFLRFADGRFPAVAVEMSRDRPPGGPNSRRKIGPADYYAAGVIYLPLPAPPSRRSGEESSVLGISAGWLLKSRINPI